MSNYNIVLKEEVNSERKSLSRLPAAIWRWHFYAGMFFAPFLILLAITGGIYLFKTQIESFMYKEYYYVEVQEQKLQPSEQLEKVKEAFPNSQITGYKAGVEQNRSTEIGIFDENQSVTVYINPYNGDILGEVAASDRVMDQIATLHGQFMMGTFGDLFQELVACWGLILLVTGIYIWWPRRKGTFKKLISRQNRGKRSFWLNIHGAIGVFISLGLCFWILTGLPWTEFWGNQFQKIAENTKIGYPVPVWGEGKPESKIPENSLEKSPISIDEVIRIADSRNIHPGYDVYFPSDPKGIYIVQIYLPKSTMEATLHIDQYSGEVLGDYRFKEYGFLGKAFSTGYAIHIGNHFGLLNQIVGLIVCLGTVATVITGIIMWWKRKPNKKLGAPPLPKNFKMVTGLMIIIILFCLIFPLVGISLLLVLLLDWMVIRRIPQVKNWFG